MKRFIVILLGSIALSGCGETISALDHPTSNATGPISLADGENVRAFTAVVADVPDLVARLTYGPHPLPGDATLLVVHNTNLSCDSPALPRIPEDLTTTSCAPTQEWELVVAVPREDLKPGPLVGGKDWASPAWALESVLWPCGASGGGGPLSEEMPVEILGVEDEAVSFRFPNGMIGFAGGDDDPLTGDISAPRCR